MTDIAKLERAIIRYALQRYPGWRKQNGELKPWGHPQAIRNKASWNLISATKALYEAKQNKR